MKIPESIRIGGMEYQVRYTPQLNDGVNLCYGKIDFEKSCIQLNGSMELSHEKLCVVLLHEILHGIRNYAGIEIAEEEAVVEMFAKGLYQVLQDNGQRLFDLREGGGEK